MTEHPTLIGGVVPSTIKHPQIEIGDGILVDERIAPLVKMAHDKGMRTRWSCQGGDDPPYELAYITFPLLQDGVEFLAQTAHHMGYTAGDKVALSIHRELAPGDGPGAKVTWHPRSTDEILRAWRDNEHGITSGLGQVPAGAHNNTDGQGS